MTNEEGFTLVELLVAMIAASLLLGSLSWMTATLGRELGRTTRDVQLHQLEVARPMLAQFIEGALADAKEGAAFERRPNGFSALVAAPQAFGRVGVVRFDLDARTMPGGQALIGRFAPARAGQSLAAAALAPQALVSGLKSVEFDYVDRPAADAAAPPKTITVTLTGPHGELPPLTFQPQVNASGTCRFDPISMACRP